MANKKQLSGSDLWQIGGSKLSKDGKRVNITLIRTKDNVKEFGTVSIAIDKGTKVCKVKVTPNNIYLAITRKYANDIERDEAFDEFANTFGDV